jgi:CubicO group peptidase (beta-lactamase class C family)
MDRTSAKLSDVDPADLAMPFSWRPGGFNPIHYRKNDTNMHAAGGHVSSVRELARYLLLHLHDGILDGRRVIPAGAVRGTHQLHAEQDRNFAFFHRHGWGLGWDIGTLGQDTLYHRFGSFAGFRSHVSFMPEHNAGIVVLVNEARLGSLLADLTAVLLYKRLMDEEGGAYKAVCDSLIEEGRLRSEHFKNMITQDLRRRAMRKQILPLPLSAYTGRFENDALGIMSWRIKGKQLEASIGEAVSTAEVYDGRRHQLRVELTGRGEVIAFQFADGRVRSMTYRDRFFTRIGD